MAVTIADVAARAGVSKTTVSRVLNGKGDLDQLTAARVREVIAELGYVPSARAVGLARGRTNVVGVLVPSLVWPWIGDVLQAIVDTLEAASYGMLLFTCTRGDESMRKFDAQVSARSFDGLLVVEPKGTLDYIAGLHESGLPVVMIDDRAQEPGFPTVATNNRLGAAAAAEHLLGVGRQRPAVVRGDLRHGCTRERLDGFAEVYARAGLPVRPEAVVDGDFKVQGGRAAVESLLRDGVEFDAVFAHNDLSAVGALQALRQAGLRVPHDVSVVGFDDVPQAQHTEPALTTVHQPLREMGEAAVKLLLAAFAEGAAPLHREVIPSRLVVRDSSVPD